MNATWLPEPPVAFLLDEVCKFDLYNTSNPDMKRSFMKIMRKFDRYTNIGIFVDIVDKRATSRLLTLKRVCADKNNSAWEAMQMFIHNNSSILYT